MNLKNIIREEMDDLQWIRDVRPIKYNIGDVIEPINGYFYYTKPWSEEYGPISGHVNAKIIDIVDEFYEVVLNYDIYEDILEAPTYYISIYDTDNKNLNESEEFDWIEDIDPDNIHIGDLEIGMEVMVSSCRSSYGHEQFPSILNRKLTVNEIYEGICIEFKEMDKIQYPFGKDREPTIPGVTICEHLGCSFKLINKEINESDDMEWIQDVPDNLNGIKFTHIDEPSKVYTIRDTEISPRRNEYHSYITVFFHGHSNGQVRRKNAYSNFKNGRWIIYDEKINESDDMDWIDDVSGDLQIGDYLIDHNGKKWSIIEIEPATSSMTLHNPLVKAKRYGLKGVYDIFTKKNIVDKISKGLWKLIPNPNINESDDMQWIKDITPIKIGDCLKGQLGKPLGHRGHADDYTYLVIDIKSFNQVKVPEIHLKVIPNAYHNATIIKPLETVLDSIENGYLEICDCLEDCHENINESDEDDFKWVEDVPDYKLPEPWKWLSDDDMYDILYTKGHVTNTMTQITMVELAHNYGYRWSKKHGGWYDRDEIEILPDIDGEAYYTINESDDMEWVDDVRAPKVGDIYHNQVNLLNMVITNITPHLQPGTQKHYLFVLHYKLLGRMFKSYPERTIYLDDFLTAVNNNGRIGTQLWL